MTDFEVREVQPDETELAFVAMRTLRRHSALHFARGLLE